MNQSESIQHRFGPAASAYATSPVHRAGPDLEAMLVKGACVGSQRLLDVGCGAGHTALAFAAQVGEVVALDLTPAMLEQAEALAREAGLANIRFEAGDASDLPFPDACFDVVTSRLAAHHFEDPARAVAEAVRVLRPGGLFLLSDCVAPEEPAFDSFLNAFELLRDASHVRDHQVGQWIQMFEAAGLQAELCGMWPLATDFDPWVARIDTPQDAVIGLRALFAHAPAPCREFFDVNDDCGFRLDVAVLAGRLPAA